MALIRAKIDTGGGAKRLGDFAKAIRTKVLRKAVNAGTVPVYKMAKAEAPVESGLLRKAIGRTVKTYKDSGVVVGIVGRRSRPSFRQQVTIRERILDRRTGKRRTVTRTMMRDPRKYAHLVIKGTKRSKANNWIDRAWGASEAQAKSLLTQKLQAETQAEAAKLAATKK